jgi:hypothetical protein
MKQSTFDNIFKVVLLLMLGFFLYTISNKINNESDIGRYKYIERGEDYVFDSKTGYVYTASDMTK